MKEHWEGDEIFCVVWLFVARIITSKAPIFASYGIPVTKDLLIAISNAILISLISGLFFGPECKRLSKKVFWATLLILVTVFMAIEFF